MFSKVAFVLSALVLAVSANDQCNTGDLYCCNSVQAANSPSAASVLHSVGAVVQGITAQVGLTCSPLSVLGLGANSCTQQPTCCTGNNFNGLVVIGCTPINL
ncbi:fungal hydrophobin-domain-containing protein [Cyathus striatus]|nr:fungal hydrophobin-domain-containing protein [Cyathus striatus]